MLSISQTHENQNSHYANQSQLFDSKFLKRWKKQMSPAWRFYYFDLERINASIFQNQSSKVLAEEYVKVSEFIKVKLGELQRRIKHATQHVSNETSLANFLELEQGLDDITSCLTELQLFKITHVKVLQQIRQHSNVSYCEKFGDLFSKDSFESLVAQLCHLYDYLRSTLSPESPPVSPISLTAETCAPRKTQAWWVHADNSTSLMMHFLKYLSLTTRDDSQESISTKINSIVLDNLCQADSSKIVKVQLSNANQELRIKTRDNDSRIRSLKTKQKYLDKWLNQEWSLSELVKKLRAQGYETKSVEAKASYIQNLVETGSVPVLQTVCDRVTFQSSTYPYIKITIDSNLKIQRECMKEGHSWQMMTDNNSITDNDNFVHFPFDVIKISIEESEENMPHWWHELIQSKLLQRVPDVYNGIDGLAGFIKNDMNSLSNWVTKVKETAKVDTITRIPSMLSKNREKGTTATSVTNESEGSTLVNIGDYQTIADEDCLKINPGCTTQYGSADLELGKSCPETISAITHRSKTRLIVLISSLASSMLIICCMLLFFLI
ncbi:hypothetical protein NQZ79_g6381 [Umbelopsis isabellina]|nr:hypothetical protein NQZ79_g6381 [Umbelopsis isabellina]